MKTLLPLLTLVALIFGWVLIAHAECIVTYVMGPDGTMKQCRQCNGGVMYCS